MISGSEAGSAADVLRKRSVKIVFKLLISSWGSSC
jgi:hypothetical protein